MTATTATTDGQQPGVEARDIPEHAPPKYGLNPPDAGSASENRPGFDDHQLPDSGQGSSRLVLVAANGLGRPAALVVEEYFGVPMWRTLTEPVYRRPVILPGGKSKEVLTRSRRPLGVAVAALAGVGLSLFQFVLPAAATPSPTVSGTIVFVYGGGGSPCVFAVGYRWSGIAAPSIELDVDATDFAAASTVIEIGPHNHSGSVSNNITVHDPNIVTYHGFGQILDRGGSPDPGTQVSSVLAGSDQLQC